MLGAAPPRPPRLTGDARRAYARPVNPPPPVAPLGTLETEVMDVVWRHDGEPLHAALQGRLAYTTVMTTMDRLFKKGLLERRKQGRAFAYRARVTRRQLVLDAGAGLIRGLIDSEGEPALSFLVDAVTERDRELLDSLERLVREKKRQAKGR